MTCSFWLEVYVCFFDHSHFYAGLILQVNLIDDMIKMQATLKLNCVNIFVAIHGLLASLLSLDAVRKDKYEGLSMEEVDSEQVFQMFLVEFCILGRIGII
jgi:hypothetical protein